MTAGGGRLDLTIRDNGAGFGLGKQRRGMGIGNMFARTAEIGGTFDVDSRPGAGTKVVLSIPYRMTTAKDYKIAAWWSGISTILALITLRSQFPNMVIVVVLAGTSFVGSLLAYRKIRKEETR